MNEHISLNLGNRDFFEIFCKFQLYLLFPVQFFYLLNPDLFPSTFGISFGTLMHFILFCFNFVFLSIKSEKNIDVILLFFFVLYLLIVLAINLLIDDLPENISYQYLGFIFSILNYFSIGYLCFISFSSLEKHFSYLFYSTIIIFYTWLFFGSSDISQLFEDVQISYLALSEIFLLISGIYICTQIGSYKLLVLIPIAFVTQTLLYSRSALVGFLVMILFLFLLSTKRSISIIILILLPILFYLLVSSDIGIERQLNLFFNLFQDSSVRTRLEGFREFWMVFLNNPLGGDLGWHVEYFEEGKGKYIHSHLSYISSFGILAGVFIIYFAFRVFERLLKKDNKIRHLAPIFFAFLIIDIFARAWMYTIIWFLIGILLSLNYKDLKREKDF